jgi:hypothetical protein
MPQVAISQVRLDANGRLRLRSSGPSAYPSIYRSASSVRWDAATGELYVLEISGFDAIAEFKQIAAAVMQEYGDHLVISSETKYVGISVEMASALGEAAV